MVFQGNIRWSYRIFCIILLLFGVTLLLVLWKTKFVLRDAGDDE